MLALHEAGYRAVIERLGPGRLLDLGCGQGFESVRLVGDDRTVVGVDYSADAVRHAAKLHDGSGLEVARSDALKLCLAGGVFDFACSSHLIEHFERPRETTMLRVLEAKAAAGEVAIGVTSAAMRACGGAAFSKHMNVERLFRDAHAGAVMAPTGDVLREFIAKAILGMPLF